MNTIDKEYEQSLAQLLQATIKYDTGDARRIHHLIKVHDFARAIAIAEGLEGEERFILEAAAILHDIGIHASEAKYGKCNGKHQEELGPIEGVKVMDAVGAFQPKQIDRICWLIAHHHSYLNVVETDHRILIEADFLVNSFEDNLSLDVIRSFRDKLFRSPSAIKMLNDMWKL